jgi:uncharacterized protein YjbJ (UPF0337 family)
VQARASVLACTSPFAIGVRGASTALEGEITTKGATVDTDRVEGKAKETEGEVQQKWGEAKDKARDTWEDVKDKVEDLGDEGEDRVDDQDEEMARR